MPQVVDLSLAVNYLPACACLGKLLVFTLAIALIPPGEEVRGFVPLAAMLYLDRMVTRNIIFDANAILLAVFFANVHAAIQAMATRHAYPFLIGGLHCCWVGMCLTLLVEPSQVKWVFEKQVKASKLVPVLLMLMVLVGTAYIQAPLEPGVIRACRGMAFTLLSFVWIYVVGIHAPNGIEYLKETSCQFVARLAPVLYSPIWLAAAFVPAAIGALMIQHSRISQEGEKQSPPQLTGVVVVNSEPPSCCDTGVTEAEDDVHELFRLAKMGRSTMRHMETIPELL